jgi:Flp pilus assembly protein TadG
VRFLRVTTAKYKSAAFTTALMRRRTEELGANLVEFALSVSIVLTSIFAVLYFSMALYADHFVANAAKDAARYAMVRGSSWNGATCATTFSYNCTATSTNVTNYVDSTVPPGLATSDLTVTTSWPGTNPSGAACDTTDGNNSPYCAVSVDVSYSLSWPLPFLPQNALVLSSTSSVAITE